MQVRRWLHHPFLRAHRSLSLVSSLLACMTCPPTMCESSDLAPLSQFAGRLVLEARQRETEGNKMTRTRIQTAFHHATAHP